MIANYHTHTRWCHHAKGEIEDYIRQAIRHGLREIAITDHVPLPGDPDPSHMFYQDFAAYNTELDRMIEKYAGRIHILKGWECEYYPDQFENYRRYRDHYGYTLLLLGHHYSQDRSVFNFDLTEPWQVELYAREACEALETGLFSYFAHPDVAMCGYRRLDGTMRAAMEQIFAACARLGIPAEINAHGMEIGRGYPEPAIWTEIAPKIKGLKVMVGADAHDYRKIVTPEVARCEKLALEAGLDLLKTLPHKNARTA